MFLDDKIHLGQNLRLVVENDRCSIYKIQNHTGDGMMTCYRLFPGIVLMHCDIHMSQYVSDLRVKTEMFSIDHCREGRMECMFENGSAFYLDAGSMFVHTSEGICPEFFCPTAHYHGVTIAVFLDEAQESVSGVLEGVDLRKLRDKFCGARSPRVLPKGKIAETVISPLYAVPESAGLQLHCLKILELLLSLNDPDISAAGEKPYFYKTQVEKVKAIERYMVENLAAPHTIEKLSTRFDFPPTSMKLCFKGVFGSSLHAYLRNRRICAAEKRLRESKDRIADIAAGCGYENAGKFAGAFRAVTGFSPSEYRRRYGGTENMQTLPL